MKSESDVGAACDQVGSGGGSQLEEIIQALHRDESPIHVEKSNNQQDRQR